MTKTWTSKRIQLLKENFFNEEVNTNGNGPMTHVEWEKLALIISKEENGDLTSEPFIDGFSIYKKINGNKEEFPPSSYMLSARVTPLIRSKNVEKYKKCVGEAAGELEMDINLDLVKVVRKRKKAVEEPTVNADEIIDKIEHVIKKVKKLEKQSSQNLKVSKKIHKKVSGSGHTRKKTHKAPVETSEISSDESSSSDSE